MWRQHCERCGETYSEDNLDTCVKCQVTACWRCGSYVTQADGAMKFFCALCVRAKSTSE